MFSIHPAPVQKRAGARKDQIELQVGFQEHVQLLKGEKNEKPDPQICKPPSQ